MTLVPPTAEARSTPDATDRGHLGERQHEVLLALLAGAVPAGFDPRTTLVTGLVLRRKRWRAAVSAFPLLGRQPGTRDLFDQYAREQRVDGCAHADVAGFLSWAARQSWPSAEDLHRCWQVEQGQRRIALSWIGDQRLLLVAVGPWLYELPMRGKRKRSDKETPS